MYMDIKFCRAQHAFLTMDAGVSIKACRSYSFDLVPSSKTFGIHCNIYVHVHTCHIKISPRYHPHNIYALNSQSEWKRKYPCKQRGIQKHNAQTCKSALIIGILSY